MVEGHCAVYGDIFNVSVASFWSDIPYDSISYSNSGSEVFISYPSTLHLNYYALSAGWEQIDTLTNFPVLGQTLPKVYRDHSSNNALIYHADSIGIVKWVFNDTINGQKTWNVLRYHVINP